MTAAVTVQCAMGMQVKMQQNGVEEQLAVNPPLAAVVAVQSCCVAACAQGS
jgi:hypothetical protein